MIKPLGKRRLRVWLGLFFVALAAPTAVLVGQAYTQLKWEAFYLHRQLAEELAARIDARLSVLIAAQEKRSFADYGFLVVAGDPAASFLQRSPLSAYPVEATTPGLVGYFQVDAEGEFSTPLLPDEGTDSTAYGVSAAELVERRVLAARLRQILRPAPVAQSGRAPQRERPAASSPIAETAAESTADRLPGDVLEGAAIPQLQRDLGDVNQRADAPLEIGTRLERSQGALSGQLRVDELELDDRYQAEASLPRASLESAAPDRHLELRTSRKERSVLPEQKTQRPRRQASVGEPEPAAVRMNVFESEIDPFELSLFDDRHLVLYRKVWRDGNRYIQGAVIELQPFLSGVIEEAFRQTALSRMSDLVVAYKANVLTAFTVQPAGGGLYGARDLKGSLLYRTRLSSPLNDLELIFTLTRLPPGPGAAVVGWMAALLSVILGGGIFLMYRLALRQIELAQQQQDFVSAVSHELKTPLTSIRMYAEMLLEGWASEKKKRSYYRYINDESERLSRLIGNVLQLAHLTRNDLQVDSKRLTVAELNDAIRSKISSHAERAGFGLELRCSAATGRVLLCVDPDCFSQIFINLTDNAIKFSAQSRIKRIDIESRLLEDGQVRFSVRDYGPGVPPDQMRKIFDLFFRTENELTRETVGTGIGLALVQQLVQCMNGRVDVVNREPGAEFQVSFPAA